MTSMQRSVDALEGRLGETGHEVSACARGHMTEHAKDVELL